MIKKTQTKKIIYVIILTIVLFFASSILSEIIDTISKQDLTGAPAITGWPLTYESENASLGPNGPYINTNNLIIDISFWLLVSVLIIYIPQTISYFKKKQ